MVVLFAVVEEVAPHADRQRQMASSDAAAALLALFGLRAPLSTHSAGALEDG